MTRELGRGLIVSCQSAEGEPLYELGLMRHFARAVVEGGAIAIRCLSNELESIKEEVNVPIIGLVKKSYPDSSVYITPTYVEIDELVAKGCDVIAIDATNRTRPNGILLQDLVRYAREQAPQIRLMADIATLEEAINADLLGFDYISTTMRGYTEQTKGIAIPDYDFIKKIIEKVRAKVIVEGGIWEVGQLSQISKLNPYSVVIGSSITRPKNITQRFVSAIKLVD